jgi:hypothetical protein
LVEVTITIDYALIVPSAYNVSRPSVHYFYAALADDVQTVYDDGAVDVVAMCGTCYHSREGQADMATEALMAKPKRKPSSKASSEPKTIGIRSSPAWAEWLDRCAAHNRTTVAGLIDQAITRYAREIGFTEPPPER